MARIERGDQNAIEEALVILEEGGFAGRVKVIFWKGQPWLVPYWHEARGRPVTKPARVIPLVRLMHQPPHPNAKGPRRWTVNVPLPNALFDRTIPPELATRFGVVEDPPIEFEIPADQN